MKRLKRLKGRKLLILPLVVLVAAGVAYKTVLAPKKARAVPRLPGALMPLSQPFVVNLRGGRYAKVSVALLLENVPASAAAETSSGTATPVPQEPAIRAVVTDMLTGLPANDLIEPGPRRRLVARLLKALRAATDNTIDKVFLTDITVQ
ncbi:MAG: flagellar basal body-associated FliL family protein [Thermoleophilia bacterium]|nr:flagellar basal body-associated FliL family protein [Thermoleophilia bacterium]